MEINCAVQKSHRIVEIIYAKRSCVIAKRNDITGILTPTFVFYPATKTIFRNGNEMTVPTWQDRPSYNLGHETGMIRQVSRVALGEAGQPCRCRMDARWPDLALQPKVGRPHLLHAFMWPPYSFAGMSWNEHHVAGLRGWFPLSASCLQHSQLCRFAAEN